METSTLQSLKGAAGQARLDALIEYAYSDRRHDLTEDDYWALGFPEPEIERRLTDAASTNEPFAWPRSVPSDARSRWRCDVAGNLYRCRDIPPDEAVEILDDTISTSRRQELLAGSPLTKEEWLTIDEINDGGFSDLFVFRTEDAQGRGLTFVAEVGAWGETVDSHGPFLDHEDPAATIVGPGDMLINDRDHVWMACTPEWQVCRGGLERAIRWWFQEGSNP